MRKKTLTQNETAEKLTGLPHDSLAKVQGGIGPGVDPGNEAGPGLDPGNEIGPGAEPGNNIGPGAEPGSP